MREEEFSPSAATGSPAPARRYGHLRCQQKWPRPRTSSAAVFSPCQKYGALLALAASPVAFYSFTTMLHARRERHSLSGTRARAVKERKRTAGHCSCLVLLHYTVRGPHVAMCVCGWITCTMLLPPLLLNELSVTREDGRRRRG
jgi:hypothetical protein